MKKLIIFLLLFGLYGTIFAQTNLLNVFWTRGDTIDTLRIRNSGHNFRLQEEFGLIRQYSVIEGQEPTTTETIFTFSANGRLDSVIYRNTGSAVAEYEQLFERLRWIYGVPKENNEFGINHNLTRENGFVVLTGNSSFENEQGSASLMVVVANNNTVIPYTFMIETYKFQENELIIPNGISSISSDIVPNSISSFVNGAFHTEFPEDFVEIQHGFGYIGDFLYRFSNTEITSVTIPESVTSIGIAAFRWNYLTSIIIPESVTSIGAGAFAGNFLTEVLIPNSVIIIGGDGVVGGAFDGNYLTSVNIPNSVTTIGRQAFFGNYLTSIEIPNSVTVLELEAFRSNRLTSVTLPDTMTYIGHASFSDNQLTGIIIPDSVNAIGSYAFANNPLTRITIGADVRFTDRPDMEGENFWSEREFVFDNGFDDFYKNNGRRAGTYNFVDGRWTRR